MSAKSPSIALFSSIQSPAESKAIKDARPFAPIGVGGCLDIGAGGCLEQPTKRSDVSMQAARL